MTTSRLTKSEMFAKIATDTNLSRAQVASVFAAFAALAEKQVGSGHDVMLPGLLKIRVVRRAATKKRNGRHPITGEAMVIKAKPAAKKVRVTALKGLRDAV